MTNNISPTPFEFPSNIHGALNPPIKTFTLGKLSSKMFLKPSKLM